MEPIVSDAEAKYVRAVTLQKQLQKNPTVGVKTKKVQAKVQKYGKKYGILLIQQILLQQYIVRGYASGPKSAVEFITAAGNITIYSHPQNPSVKPKLEVYHPAYGFIAWWNQEEFEETKIGASWSVLCAVCKYNPSDESVVINEQRRIDELLKE